jgi:hypothetical protein
LNAILPRARPKPKKRNQATGYDFRDRLLAELLGASVSGSHFHSPRNPWPLATLAIARQSEAAGAAALDLAIGENAMFWFFWFVLGL